MANVQLWCTYNVHLFLSLFFTGPTYWTRFRGARDVYAINLADFTRWRGHTLSMLQTTYIFNTEMFVDEPQGID